MTDSFVIAIDGLAATGKGTLARRLAAALDLAYLDTGLLYRAVGMQVLRDGGDPANPVDAERAAQTLDSATLEDPSLRTDEAAQAASKVAVHAGVRASLLKFQQDFAAQSPKGAVLDGRDIGTVIAPDAKVKIFVTASPEVRAHRRFLELLARGENVTEAAVLEELKERDARDQTRSVVPTKPADDAVILDTSELGVEEVFKKALLIVKDKLV